MTDNHDERLRDDFKGLRADVESSGRVPDFASMLEKAKADAASGPDLQVLPGEGRGTRRRLYWAGGWASAALAATLAGLLLVGRGPSPDEEFELLVAAYTADVASGALRSPTAGLLDVPGMNLTRSLPSIGTMIRGLDPTQLPNAPETEGRDS